MFTWPIYLYIIQHASCRATFDKNGYFYRRNYEISNHPKLVGLQKSLGQTNLDLRMDKQVELAMKRVGMDTSMFYIKFDNELTVQ